MEVFFYHRGNGRAASQNKVLFSSFFDAKMAEILAQHSHPINYKAFPVQFK